MANTKKKLEKISSKTVRMYLDPIANTLNIWWDDPKKAYASEEVDSPTSNDVIIKDKQGKPISIEIIGIFPKELNIAEYLKNKTVIKKQDLYLLEAR